MIVPMKHLTLLCTASSCGRTLEALRELKCAHFDSKADASAETAVAGETLAKAESAVRILSKSAEDFKGHEGLDKTEDFSSLKGEAFVDAVLAADARRKSLEEEADKLRQTIRRYEPYGDFDPALAQSLVDGGIDLKGVVDLPDPLPRERLSVTRRRLSDKEEEISGVKATLAAAAAEAQRITSRYPELKDRIAFAAARDKMESEGEISWISGWIPQDAVPAVRARSVKEGWGIMVRDPEPGETPPVCIRPPKLFRPVLALFEGLGIAPAYEEADVSVPFFCYFALFFAMLVGDGGYGLVMLALSLLGWRKTKPKDGEHHRPRTVRSWLTLMTVFSFGTVVWGALSNAWFGAALPFAADWPTVRWLGDPTYHNMMFLCFTIGLSHLMLARIWNGICMINSVSCIAEFGWAGILLFMYFVVNVIIGIFPSIPVWSYWVFGVSAVLVAARTRGSALGMLPLNIMGAMGDIISYVRLFAVGYASLQVAQNFNRMAVELDLPIWAKIVPMVLILLIGHGMNFMLAGLAVLVHAVRLNTLEFSNHKGITWSGQAFCPFRKN